MTHDEILALVHRRHDAMTGRQMEALATLYAESVDIESPLAGSAHGRDALMKSITNFFKAFPDAVIREDEPVIDGDRVAIFGDVSGSDVGGIMGLAPSGRAFRFPIATSLTVRDGHIVNERRVYDFTGLLVQIGALKAKPA